MFWNYLTTCVTQGVLVGAFVSIFSISQHFKSVLKFNVGSWLAPVPGCTAAELDVEL